MSNEEKRAVMRANVLGCLWHGRDYAKSLVIIANQTRYHKRLVRQLIEELRGEGNLICNEQNGEGYYIAQTEEEVRKQYIQDCRRAMSILRRIKPFRKALLQAEEDRYQIRFDFMDSVADELLDF